jgi:hypothetical protein
VKPDIRWFRYHPDGARDGEVLEAVEGSRYVARLVGYAHVDPAGTITTRPIEPDEVPNWHEDAGRFPPRKLGSAR